MRDRAFARLAAEAKDRPTVAQCLLQLALADDETWSGPRDELPAAERDAGRGRAVARYRQVIGEFADVRAAGDLFDPARQAGIQLRRLASVRPGLPAVPTAGPDAAGDPMSLADFTGRVVVLVVRSSGCDPYRGRLEELKRLAAQYAPKGVAFVGIAGGPTELAARTAVADDKLPWRTWLDVHPGPGPNGPLAAAWCTEGGPDLIVIDRAGVIRYFQAHEYFLPKVLDKVLAETPKS